MTDMTETELILLGEIGKTAFANLISTLSSREDSTYNVVGWNGNSSELGRLVQQGELCPASSFAVVAEGMRRYRRQESQQREDTDSMRNLAKIILEGSGVYGEAREIDEQTLLAQIQRFVTSHGGEFQGGVDWQEFIADVSERLKKKADAIDEANR